MDLYGPDLPPGYVKPVDDDLDDSDDSSPAKSDSKTSSKIIGPQCPSFLSRSEDEKEKEIFPSPKNSASSTASIGPELPEHLRKSEMDDNFPSDEVCGPALTEFGEDIDDVSDRKAQIEKRAEKMKNKLDNKDIPVKVNEREEWMTVPDTSRRNQLGAISRCLAPSQSSSKDRRTHTHRHSEKDKKTSEELKKYNKSRRSESLMDTHEKKLKKKEKEKKSKDKERKAFDRDEMAVRHFTKDQVNSVIDKAKYLNSRFAPGNKQYL